ncbi:MAG: hypothetical protein KBA06_05265 [Saprospiraceae bacterium]|nr:hypothetical protein [Saprospiraceae bacterium]
MNFLFELYSIDLLFSIACLFWGFSSSALGFETKRRKLFYSNDPLSKELTKDWALPGNPNQTHSWSGLMNLYVLLFIFITPCFSSSSYMKLLGAYLIGATVFSFIGRIIYRIVYFSIMKFAHIFLSFVSVLGAIVLPIINIAIKI